MPGREFETLIVSADRVGRCLVGGRRFGLIRAVLLAPGLAAIAAMAVAVASGMMLAIAFMALAVLPATTTTTTTNVAATGSGTNVAAAVDGLIVAFVVGAPTRVAV
jgi:hypothetical protein